MVSVINGLATVLLYHTIFQGLVAIDAAVELDLKLMFGLRLGQWRLRRRTAIDGN